MTAWMKIKTTMLHKKKPDVYLCAIYFIDMKYGKVKLIYSARKLMSHCLGLESRKGVCLGTYEVNILYFLWGAGLHGCIHLSKCGRYYTSNGCILLCVNYASIHLN